MKAFALVLSLALAGCSAAAVGFRSTGEGTSIRGSYNGEPVRLWVDPDGTTTGTIGGRQVEAWTDAAGRTVGTVEGRPFSCYLGICN